MRVGRFEVRIRSAILTGLGLLALVSAGRAIHSLSELEEGWRTFRDQWRGAAVGLCRADRYRIPEQEPAVQARFWLDESRRILQGCDDPDLAEGAAWVLDRASLCFLRRYRSDPRLFPGADTELGFDGRPSLSKAHEAAARRAEEEFERLCRTECRAALELATRLAPDDPERWRSRASLAFQGELWNLETKPQISDWLAELERCAAHDPGNGLYDYLAARELWSQSAKRGFVPAQGGIQETLTIIDHTKYEEGAEHFRTAQAKRFLLCGTMKGAATRRFLRQSSLSAPERMMILSDRSFTTAALWLIVELERWKRASFDELCSQGDLDAAAQQMHDVLRLGEQWTPSLVDWGYAGAHLRERGIVGLLELATAHPDRPEAADLASLEERHRDARLEFALLARARENAREGTVAGGTPHRTTLRRARIDAVILAWSMQTAILFLVGVAAASATGGWGLAQSFDSAGPGWRTQCAAWTIGLGSTFVVLGLGPTEYFVRSRQTMVLRGFLWLAPIVIAAAILWFFHRRQRGRFRDLAALALTVVIPVVAIAHPGLIADALVWTFAEAPPFVSIVLLVGVPCIVWWVAGTAVRFWRSADALPNYRAYVTAALLFTALWLAAAGPGFWIFLQRRLPDRNWTTPASWGVTTTQWIRGVGPVLYDQMTVRPVACSVPMWSSRYGHLLAAALALAIVFCASLHRQGRADGTGLLRGLLSDPRKRLGTALQSVARTAAAAALLVLLAYLPLVPVMARAIDADLHSQENWYRDPASQERELSTAVAAIEADPEAMAEIARQQELWLRNFKDHLQTRLKQQAAPQQTGTAVGTP